MGIDRTEETTYYTHPSLGVFEVTIMRYTDEYRAKARARWTEKGYPTPSVRIEDLIDVRIKSPTGKIIDVNGAAAIEKTEEETRKEIIEALRIRLIGAKQQGEI